MLPRLAIAAPAVWLGWFSAVQFGNIIRVQEDYAFKEATSKAFAGYRDHMEHLRKIGDEEGVNALQMLADRTIEILSREPLRIYGKPHRDVTPWQEILEYIRTAKLKEKAKEEAPKEE